MELTRLVVLELAPGEAYAHTCGDAEWIVLPLSGPCEVHYTSASPDPGPQTPDGLEDPAPRGFGGGAPEGGRGAAMVSGRGGVGEGPAGTFRLRGRVGVFAGPTDFAYLPRDAHAEISSEGGGRFALVGARCERRLAPRYGPAASVPVELRGAGQCSRQVHNFAAADAFDCDRLIAVEVLTPGGNWSSYPPHKHDEHQPGEESRLEEIYFYEIAPHGDTPGVGYQRVTPSHAGKTDVLAEVRSGDVVLIPDGWHGPSIAAPGHDMYYLNVMAGPDAEREWLIRDHPDHAWIRDTWPGRQVDPRLPFPRTPEPGRDAAPGPGPGTGPGPGPRAEATAPRPEETP
ncbi:5-deoxy-glucuronate isomerase [Streptomyces sp. WAC07149]|uniref:5-deoxy-glucuronate isomerase n=1 Tax=Streptomyces sp. WAC07149 TaxID=2487425 RepID=UPI000F777763|nr:5-deoxy-glucuronate isomerase [Streptomyces sp. WAC07149]RST02215.1 5-deoxy-glucuronate isomerase [Streptomyces sp. WAC07149]